VCSYVFLVFLLFFFLLFDIRLPQVGNMPTCLPLHPSVAKMPTCGRRKSKKRIKNRNSSEAWSRSCGARQLGTKALSLSRAQLGAKALSPPRAQMSTQIVLEKEQ